MRKPFIAIALILLTSSLSYAFEDYRWENPSTVVHSTGFFALTQDGRLSERTGKRIGTGTFLF